MSISEVIKAISNDKSLALFDIVALASGNSETLKSTLKLTRRQYYKRMAGLVDAGLVIRKNGKYFPTSFGGLVYEAQRIIGKAIEIYWKLKAIDSFQMLSTEEYIRILDTLLEGYDELREILLRHSNNIDAGQKQKTPDKPELIVT
jgi:predicted transcriptional regulator